MSERFEFRNHTCGKLKKNVHKFENLGHSNLVISGCLDQVSMHICVKYEGSVINQICREAIVVKKEKWLLLKRIGHIDLIFHAHIY